MPAILAIWHDIDPSVEDDYAAWYDDEHFPERLGVPGFLNGQRFEALDGSTRPGRLAFYEVRDLAVLADGEYRRRLNHPTPRTTRVIGGFRNAVRGACSLVIDRAARPDAHGDFCATVELRADASRAALGAAVDKASGMPGVVRVRVIEGDAGATGPMTVEQRLRGSPDQPVGRVALVEADRPDALRAVDAMSELAAGSPRRYRRLRYADAAQFQRG